ncbi:MAG: ABC transporter substrate-binding protein [Saprospiraceae bacterium]|nr:hypothetical protein [Saprospiraceae bacterium]MCB9342914.1 hypothetical protein [Lewinellaceae bacterium]
MNTNFFASKNTFLFLLLLASVFMFCAVSCTDDAEVNQTTVVNIRYDAAASNLNPYLTALGSDIYSCARIFQTLGDLDPKSLELEPMIVTSIPQVRTVKEGEHEGELAYDFELLPEATWDNGTPVTGHDMEFTMKLIFHPLLPTKAYAGYFKDLTGIETDQSNPKKFTVYFKQYYILALESICQIAIMPAYNYDPENLITNIPLADFLYPEKSKTLESNPNLVKFAEVFQQPKYGNDPASIVGSGPYRMETMNDQGLILVKKQSWWGDKVSDKRPILAAYPEKLVYKVVKDENVVENMMKSGELDIIAGSLSPGKFLEMKEKDSLTANYDFTLLPALQYNRWLLNLTKPNLQDVRVRKALAHIVDYNHFIKNIRKNLAVRSLSPILPNKRYYAKDLEYYDFNIDKAKELLKEAGWTDTDGDGFVDKMLNGKKVKFVLEVLVPPIRSNQQYAESVTETARLAGIEIKSITTDLTEISPKTKRGDYESAFIGAVLFPGLSELSQRYHSRYVAPAGDNRSRYINPKLDEILEAIAAETDDAKRDQYYLEAQKIIHEDLPEIFLFSPAQPIITSKKFDGVVTPNRPGYYEQMFKLKK